MKAVFIYIDYLDHRGSSNEAALYFRVHDRDGLSLRRPYTFTPLLLRSPCAHSARLLRDCHGHYPACIWICEDSCEWRERRIRWLCLGCGEHFVCRRCSCRGRVWNCCFTRRRRRLAEEYIRINLFYLRKYNLYDYTFLSCKTSLVICIFTVYNPHVQIRIEAV